EVPDPSGLFLSQGAAEPGTCVAIAMEGRRALPVEVQALTIDTNAPNPLRVVNGLDSSRVAMVLAILERRAGIATSKLDVYVSTDGGVRFTEPAADLAIAIAVAGSIRQRSVPRTIAAVGELSLAGEIRPVTQAAQRRNEAARLGYQRVVDERSKTLRDALNDVRSQTGERTRDSDIPPFWLCRSGSATREATRGRVEGPSDLERPQQLVGRRLHRMRTRDVQEHGRDRVAMRGQER